jgi:hypothetical protein
MMKLNSLVGSGATLMLGLLLGFTLSAHPQSNRTSLNGLSQETKVVSRLDWVLLNARVQALEWSSIQDFSRPVSPAGFEFDGQTGKVISKAFVDPSWLAKNNMDEVNKVFTARAADLCAVGVGGSLLDEHSPVSIPIENSPLYRLKIPHP